LEEVKAVSKYRYKAIDKTFTLVDKLRNTVPPNIKWIDKNVHKVIGNIIKLKELEEVRQCYQI
jgi:hypothetical protein